MDGYRDINGDWVEEFRSQPYETKDMAERKIEEVLRFHVLEHGWEQCGTPSIETNANGEYVAVIPLKKPASEKVSGGFNR